MMINCLGVLDAKRGKKESKKAPTSIFRRVGCCRADFHHPVKLGAVLVKYYIRAVASNASVKFMRG